MSIKKICAIGLSILFIAVFARTNVWAEKPGKTICIAAGETWSTYITPTLDSENWYHTYWGYVHDIKSQNDWQQCIFRSGRLVDGSQFGAPCWTWMSGLYLVDGWTNQLTAIEYNPSEEFAAINQQVSVANDDIHFSTLHYNTAVVGADDPARNFFDPGEDLGCNLTDDRSYAYGTAAWPTNLGVDVKLTAHSWTTPWGHLDDFHLIEIELYNTGKTDINGDGVVELENNRINALTLSYSGTPFGMYIQTNGRRRYFDSNSSFRGMGTDLTPDQYDAPYDISFQGNYLEDGVTGSVGVGDYQGLTEGFYYDAYRGHTFLGAKTYNEETGTWEEKHLCFKDADGKEIVPAVGEGEQRGWFRTNQPQYSLNRSTLKENYENATGCFYVNGGKNNDPTQFDLNPNPALFQAGEEGDITTFIAKDPSEWAYPDGAYEKAPPVMCHDNDGNPIGINPVDQLYGSTLTPLEPDVITEGVTTSYHFNGSMINAMGPFAIEVGERVRLYFVRASGFRMAGLRKSITTARAVFNSIQPDGSYIVPQAPPVPEIKVSFNKDVQALVKWQDPSSLGDCDGIKIYKSQAWPLFNPMYEGFPEHNTWWKTMDPDVRPTPEPYNSLLDTTKIFNQQGNFWGPYDCIAVIPKSEFENYVNPEADISEYPYAYVDVNAIPGQSYWYYVSSYKENASIPSYYTGMEDVSWIESGKVNINGRTGMWEEGWPQSTGHYSYPDADDAEGLKKIGAVFVLSPPPAELVDVEQGKVEIKVRPNPFKRAAFHDVNNVHKLMFYNLPTKCDISIYDLAGMLVDKNEFIAPTVDTGIYFWDMHSKNGNEVASGLYIWVVEFDGGKQMGKLAILR